MDYKELENLLFEVEYYNHRVATPSWVIEDAIIDFDDITYIIGGKAEYCVNGKKQLVTAGDLIYIPSGCQRSAVTFADNLVESHCLNGQISLINGEKTNLPFPTVSHIGHHLEILNVFKDFKSAWLMRDSFYQLRTRGLALMILQQYLQLILLKNRPAISDPRIKKAVRYAIEHYNQPVSTEEMASLIGLSTMYFGNLFKQETGMSFNRYAMSIRINHAEDMLCSGEFNVNEVASACGFANIFYFSKVFKSFRGVPPSKYLSGQQPQPGDTASPKP